MVRLLALLVALGALGARAPQLAVLEITVTVTAADGSTHSVPRQALLVSDDPVTASPQRFVTGHDGTAEAHLRAGAYVVESDTPFVFEGKSYEWSQRVTVGPGSRTTLALTGANAMIEAVQAGAVEAPAMAAAAMARAETSLLDDWQDSVVAIWTPRRSGRGVLVGAAGLVATNQRLVGKDTAVEVQFSATKKVAGRVIASDPSRNVAIIWIDPRAAAPARAMTPGDGEAVRQGDTVYAIDGRIGETKSLVSGTVERVSAHAVASDVPLGRDSSGAPLFTRDGVLVAITTVADDATIVNRLSPRAVRIDDARLALAEAEQRMRGGSPPAATRLPVDPARPFPKDALARAAAKRGGSVSAYAVAGSDFDVHIITPPMIHASLHRQDSPDRFDYARDDPARGRPTRLPLDDFGAWNDYVSEAPPVVLVRVTPKFGERFWAVLARGAAQTQGVSIPAITRPKALFAGLRLTCGAEEVAPIHPFRIEHRLGDATSIDEGLYAFDAAAFSPQCGSVRITLLSGTAQDTGDVRTIDAQILRQVWDDFAPYR